MGIEVIDKALKQYRTQVAVAAKLGISPHRLNNWIRERKVPAGWSWGLAKRLGLK